MTAHALSSAIDSIEGLCAVIDRAYRQTGIQRRVPWESDPLRSHRTFPSLKCAFTALRAIRKTHRSLKGDAGNAEPIPRAGCPGFRRGNPQAGTLLGPPLVPDSRKEIETPSRRSLRVRRTPRRHRRTLVLLDDKSLQRPNGWRGRGPELRPAQRRNSIPAARRRRMRRRPPSFFGRDAARRRMEYSLQVFRQPRTNPSPHAPKRCVRKEGRAERKTRSVLLPSAVQHDRKQFSAHLHGPGSWHDEGRRRALP